MAFVEGRITTVRVDLDGTGTYTDVGGVTDASLSLTSTAIDTTTHGTSRAKTYIAGRVDATLSFSGLFDDSDGGQNNLVESWNPDGTPSSNILYFEYDVGSGASYDTYKAQGTITDLSFSAPNEDATTFDCSVQLTGAVTIA